MGLVGWSGSGLTLLTAIVPPVLLTIAIGDSLHLLIRFAEERRTLDASQAATRTGKAMWRACLATSLTTAIGFAALLLADTPAVRGFALVVTFGVGVAFCSVVFLLPTMLSRTHWTGRVMHGAHLASLARWARRRRRFVVFGALILLALCGAGVTRLEHGTRLLSPFGDADPHAALARELDADFGGVRRMQFGIEGDPLSPDTLTRTRSLSTWLAGLPEVGSVRSATTILDDAWRFIGEGALPSDAAQPLARLSGAALVPFVADGAQRCGHHAS